MKKLILAAALALTVLPAFAQVMKIEHNIINRKLDSQEGYLNAGSSAFLYNETGGTQHYTVFIQLCVDVNGCTNETFTEYYLKPGESKRIDQGITGYFRFNRPEGRDYCVTTRTWKGDERVLKTSCAMVEAY